MDIIGWIVQWYDQNNRPFEARYPPTMDGFRQAQDMQLARCKLYREAKEDGREGPSIGYLSALTNGRPEKTS